MNFTATITQVLHLKQVVLFYTYACTILSLVLFVSELDDAVREGDGDRVGRGDGYRVGQVWKYLILFFSNGCTKYALEPLTQQKAFVQLKMCVNNIHAVSSSHTFVLVKPLL